MTTVASRREQADSLRNAVDSAPPIDLEAPALPTKRKKSPRLLVGLVAAAAVVGGAFWVTSLGRETTDDAQVEGRAQSVSARVAGQVLKVDVTDNQEVKEGETLVQLDPSDFLAKVKIARADLAAAKATANGARSTLELTEKTAPASVVQAQGALASATSSVTSAHASIAQAQADIAAADSRRALAALNLKRAKSLLESNSISTAEVDARQTELDDANARFDQATARLDASHASLTGSGGGVVLARGRLTAADTASEQLSASRATLELAEAHVAQAEATLELAELNLSYTTVKATRHGIVSRRTVEEGQLVGPERPLMVVVPLDDVWIVANFKEDQLADMHPGAAATVRLDTYGRRELHGHVESIAGGTGARFALLPPDNATGNFVKVVQRIPVLVRLDGASGVELRPGMSADVSVRTAQR